jgi:anti-sigma regulatory factor (Ser/Thr protein kinase)
MENAVLKDEVSLTIPMDHDMELVAAKTGSVLAELNHFNEEQIEEIQYAIIETCINAFEHSQSEDRKVYIIYIRRADELECKITDHGVGFTPEDKHNSISKRQEIHSEMRKRGWGLEITETLMDEFYIESGENGTTVSFTKKVTS